MLANWFQQRRYRQHLVALNSSPLAAIYTPPTLTEAQTLFATEFLALDMETTGLNPKTDHVLSMGWAPMRRGRIQLGQSEHYFVRHTDTIPDASVAIHHITEQEAANGAPIIDIFPHLLKQLSGKVLIAHFADIEVGFLQRLSKKIYGITLPIMTIDTLQLAFHLKYKNAVHVPQNALSLFSLREQYALPRYKAHNALTDAVAAAELLLALSETSLHGQKKTTLAQLRVSS